MDYLTTSTIRRGFVPGFVNSKKGCTRLAGADGKKNCLLAHGRWFFPGTPVSSTTKTGRHDITEILLKTALTVKHNKHNSRCKIYIFSRVYNASEPYIFVLKVSNKTNWIVTFGFCFHFAMFTLYAGLGKFHCEFTNDAFAKYRNVCQIAVESLRVLRHTIK